MYAAGFMSMLGGLVGLHAQQVGSYGRLGWTGFILALIGTPFLVARAVILLLPVSPGLASGPYFELARLLLISGLLLLGIATIKAKALPRWCGFAIILAGLAMLSPYFLPGASTSQWLAVLGLVWLGLSYALWAKRRAAV